MLSPLLRTAMLFGCLLLLTGCDAKIRAATNITPTSARLNFEGRTDCDAGAFSHLEYSSSLATLEDGNGMRSPEQRFGITKGACDENPPSYRFGWVAKNLQPDTSYFYRLCGRDDRPGAEERCTAVSQFATDRAPGPIQPVTVEGDQLMADGEPFHFVGLNAPVEEGLNAYLRKPSFIAAVMGILAIQDAKTMGATALRINLMTFDFVERDADGELTVRADRIAALRGVIKTAEQQRMHLVLTGANVWLRSEAPAWYDELSNEGRWDVQEFFWREIAKVGSESDAVLAYELMNEPAISANPEQDWYEHTMGGYAFAGYVARGIPINQQSALGRQWMKRMHDAVHEEDPTAISTIGALPFVGGPFGAANQAASLDMLSVHTYVAGEDRATKEDMVAQYASHGKPVFIGETASFQTSKSTQEAYLRTIAPQVAGIVSFYTGRHPDEDPNASMNAAINNANARHFMTLREVILNRETSAQ